ncbi:MAG: TatD family nuclease-associated radical SAM protein [Candidatus Bathyarchaeota archaeon]|nr:TatD family nuclease-associated radical SAM protein [Candidatus Bathyarchaeota archaeon]
MALQKPAVAYWLDNSLYLNITNQCSNNCWFCFRNYKQGVGGFNLKHTQEPNFAEVVAELEKTLPNRRWSEVVFCGFGEPTARLDLLLDVAKWIKAHYPTIPIRLDTNGHGNVLNKGRNVAQELHAAGVSRVSVSLNGHNEETYRDNCRPNFNGAYTAILDFVLAAKAAGLEVEVSAVRMPEVDIQKVKAVADGLGVPFRIRDYIPCFW